MNLSCASSERTPRTHYFYLRKGHNPYDEAFWNITCLKWFETLTDAKHAIQLCWERQETTKNRQIWCCVLLHDTFVAHFEEDTQGDKQDTLHLVLRTPAAHCGHTYFVSHTDTIEDILYEDEWTASGLTQCTSCTAPHRCHVDCDSCTTNTAPVPGPSILRPNTTGHICGPLLLFTQHRHSKCLFVCKLTTDNKIIKRTCEMNNTSSTVRGNRMSHHIGPWVCCPWCRCKYVCSAGGYRWRSWSNRRCGDSISFCCCWCKHCHHWPHEENVIQEMWGRESSSPIKRRV